MARTAPKPSRRGLFWLALTLLLVAVVILGGSSEDEGVAFDPDSVSPSGAKGLRLLLESFGGDVDVTDTVEGYEPPDVVLVLDAALSAEQEDEVLGFARSGGVVVVADPTVFLGAPLQTTLGSAGGFVTPDELDPESCSIDALADLGSIDPGGGTAYGLRVGSGDDLCYGTVAGGAFVVASAEGRGTIVTLGGPTLLTNEHLGSRDNAPLAVNLLVPTPGRRIAWLEPGRFDGFNEGASMAELVPDGAVAAFVLFSGAAVLVVAARGRRLGRPVREPRPVELAGSEFTLAVGNVLQRSNAPERAARVLRADLARDLRSRFGLSVHLDPAATAEIVAARSGGDLADIQAAIAGPPASDDAALVELANQIESVRREVLG